MKRIMFSALIVPLLLFLVPSERGAPQQELQPSLKDLQWKVVRTDVVKTDLGDDFPEVAVLNLTNEQFKQISASKAAAMKFFDNGIFKKKLVKVVFCDVRRYKGGEGWVLIVPHTYTSTAFVIAWQIPKKGGK